MKPCTRPVRRRYRLLLQSAKGQVVVIVAAFVPVAVSLLVLVFAVGSLWRQMAAVQAIADAASRTGSMQVDVDHHAQGRLVLDCQEALDRTRQMLVDSLRNLPYALMPGVTPQDIANSAEIYVINTMSGTGCSVPGGQWTSPFEPYNTYTLPVVAVRIVVPSKLFFMNVPLKGTSENIILSPGGVP